MRHMANKVQSVICLVLLLLCGASFASPGKGSGPKEGCTSCPVSSIARSFLEESVVRNVLEAKWIMSNTHSGTFASRGFARNLIAWSSSHVGSYTLAETCTGPKTFDPTCFACEASEPCAGFERCFQLGCEAAGIDTAEVWWQPAPITYTTDQRHGPRSRVTYSDQPTTNLRFDAATPNVIKVSWIAQDKVSARIGKRAINVSSSLSATGRVVANEPVEAQETIEYDALACAEGDKTVIRFSIDATGAVSGTIEVDGQTIATIVQTSSDETAQVIWISGCN